MSESPTPRRTARRRRTATALIASGAVAATTALALLPGTASASSHREAPLIADAPAYDNTDLYAFVSPDRPDKVTFVSNWFGLQEPNGGPTFYPWADDARYNIKIDSDGDAKADVTYEYVFRTENDAQSDTFLYANGPVTSLHDENLLFKQFWTLTKIDEDGKRVVVSEGQAAPSNAGEASIPDYRPLIKEATKTVGNHGSTYVGGAEDPFFLDLRVFDLLYGGDLSETGQDTLAGYNVNTTVLQVPIKDVVLNGNGAKNPVIGIWSTTDRSASVTYGGGEEKTSGDYVQVSRLGNPLVNEVVLPVSLKDAFNGIGPDVDATIPAVVERVTKPEVPKLVEAIYGIPAPATPRNDLVEIFLTGIAKNAPTLDGSTPPIQADLNSQVLNGDVKAADFVPSEMLRLNTAVKPTKKPNRLGVLGGDLQGFPNGRRLADDVVDIALQAVEGAAVSGIVKALDGGDEVDENDTKFSKSFPYVAPPTNRNVNDRKNSQEVVPFGAPGTGVGPGLPAPSVVTGIAALALLGAGVVMGLRGRRPTRSAVV